MPVRRTTIRDIANELSVTPSTVSRALSGNTRISEATRQRVREAATRLNYQQNRVASSLRRGQTNIIGVLVPTLDRHFFGSVVRGIEEVARDQNYTVMVTQSNEDPKTEYRNIEALLGAQVDGVIASVSKGAEDPAVYASIVARGVPLILFDRVFEGLAATKVIIDDRAGAFAATDHLIRQGYDRLLHLAGPTRRNIYRDRLQGFRDALATHDLPFDPDRNVRYTDHEVETSRKIVAEALRSSDLNGVFSASDWGGMGAMIACREAGLRVPEDFGVVGFANEPFTGFIHPPLSTVDQQSEEIGRRAANSFLKQVRGQGVAETIVLQPRLVQRRSSGGA